MTSHSRQTYSISSSQPWVIVAGGFHSLGGQDKANAALAEYLLMRQTPVHIVAHQVEEKLRQYPLASVHLVPRPAGSYFLGEWLLARRGQAIAREITTRYPGARVVVNGGCCDWADINWVHSVHHAWPYVDAGAPNWFRLKNRLTKTISRYRERRAIGRAHLVIANSEQTRRNVIHHFQNDSQCVKCVYLGIDPTWGEATPQERREARTWLGLDASTPLIVFAGALSHDQNKGMDTLWAAWQTMCASSKWDAQLVVAGGGQSVRHWRALAERSGLKLRVRILGFTDRVADLLAAADLLISPVRYEAYGLNVQEAICRGVPAMVSSRAGVTERYPEDLTEMILPDPEDVNDLVNRLWRWRKEIEIWKERFRPLAQSLRRSTWMDMAEQIVAFAEADAANSYCPTSIRTTRRNESLDTNSI